MTSPVPLAEGFPVFSEADWHAAVAKVRHGSASADSLDPIAAGQLHGRRLGARPIVGRPPGGPWTIVQRIGGGATTIARAISDAATGGATGVELVFAGSSHPLPGRLTGDAVPGIASALAAAPEGLQIRVDIGSAAIPDALLDLAATRNAELVSAFDPAAATAVRGSADDASEAVRLAARALDARKVAGRVVIADGRLWHAGGANEEQELGVALATFVAYLRLLAAPDRIGIALAVDADQFRGIAKLRAMRLLLARIAEIAALPALSPPIHAETAWRMLGTRDPHMNILRATSAAFAAAVGGADSITVLPFDALAGRSDGHADRLARNTQTILAEEAQLFRVADSAAGSGAIEALTSAFAAAAWQRFQAIEAEGGIVAAIAEGSLLRDVAETREARLARVTSGDMRLVDVDPPRGDAGARVRRTPVRQAKTLTFKRLAAPFEAPPP